MINYDFTDEQILAAAKAAHECNRAFCVAIGDNTQMSWEWASQEDKEAVLENVKQLIEGNLIEVSAQHAVFNTVVKCVLRTIMENEETLPGV